MKKALISAALAALLSVATLAYGKSYSCPEDNCLLIYTGKDKFCVGINCRHVKIYQCGCCGKEWNVYMPKGQ